MNTLTDKLAAALYALAVATLAGCSGSDKAREFVCTTHDKLTERHVGVAWIVARRNGSFLIRYVDGDGSDTYYTPRPGEACRSEIYRNAVL